MMGVPVIAQCHAALAAVAANVHFTLTHAASQTLGRDSRCFTKGHDSLAFLGMPFAGISSARAAIDRGRTIRFNRIRLSLGLPRSRSLGVDGGRIFEAVGWIRPGGFSIHRSGSNRYHLRLLVNSCLDIAMIFPNNHQM
jgi:hypothetical protein